MQTDITLSFIEKLRYQIKAAQRKYHDALNSNKGLEELRLIKDSIEKLQSCLGRIMKNMPGYVSKEE